MSKCTLPLNPFLKHILEISETQKLYSEVEGYIFERGNDFISREISLRCFSDANKYVFVLQFCQTEINLTITNISRVETHNPIGGYRVMFVQYFSARVVDLLSTFFPNFRPFLRGAFRR